MVVHFILSHNLDYVTSLWNEISSNTGILNNEVNPNLWHDVFWKYLSFIDPQVPLICMTLFPEREFEIWYI